jgi:hypothetical protein
VGEVAEFLMSLKGLNKGLGVDKCMDWDLWGANVEPFRKEEDRGGVDELKAKMVAGMGR